MQQSYYHSHAAAVAVVIALVGCVNLLQDHKLQGEEAGRPFYMPTSMDNAVASFRRWMREAAGPVPWAVPVGPETWAQTGSRRELLDRYNQHTKHCKSCSQVSMPLPMADHCISNVIHVCLLVYFLTHNPLSSHTAQQD